MHISVFLVVVSLFWKLQGCRLLTAGIDVAEVALRFPDLPSRWKWQPQQKPPSRPFPGHPLGPQSPLIHLNGSFRKSGAPIKSPNGRALILRTHKKDHQSMETTI